MNHKMLVEILAAHADLLAGGDDMEEDYLSLFPSYRDELAPLLHLARQVRGVLARVEPSAAFRRRLRQELLALSRQQAADASGDVRPVWRRPWVIGAAAAGSLISIASALGVIAHRKRAKAAGQATAG